MGIHKRTLRQLSPLRRELAETLNELDAARRRFKRLDAKIEFAEQLAMEYIARHPDEFHDLQAAYKALGRRLPRNNGRDSVEGMLDGNAAYPALTPEARERARMIDRRLGEAGETTPPVGATFDAENQY